MYELQPEFTRETHGLPSGFVRESLTSFGPGLCVRERETYELRPQNNYHLLHIRLLACYPGDTPRRGRPSRLRKMWFWPMNGSVEDNFFFLHDRFGENLKLKVLTKSQP